MWKVFTTISLTTGQHVYPVRKICYTPIEHAIKLMRLTWLSENSSCLVSELMKSSFMVFEDSGVVWNRFNFMALHMIFTALSRGNLLMLKEISYWPILERSFL